MARGPISLPCRIVHMLSEQPQPTITSASLISSAASGVANPPLTSRFHGLPPNRPLATAEVASSAPHASASRSSAAAWPRAPRPATNTGRRAPRSTPASAVTASAAGATGYAFRIAGTGPAGPGPQSAPWTSSGRARTTVRRPSVVA